MNAAGGGKMTRSEVFTLYAIERILYRVGRSPHAKLFVLKGGMLAGALFDNPFRATRDADFLGPGRRPSVRRIRAVFDELAVVDSYAQDAIRVARVRAMRSQEDVDGYDGVKVLLDVAIGQTVVTVQVDVGFGDGVSPKPRRLVLPPLLKDEQIAPANVYAYPIEAFVAEKLETLMSKFPVVSHRLKDLVDVYAAITISPFDAATTLSSFRRTYTARSSVDCAGNLQALATLPAENLMRQEWSKMLRDKRVSIALPDMRGVIGQIIHFGEPLIEALVTEGVLIGGWDPEQQEWTFREDE